MQSAWQKKDLDLLELQKHSQLVVIQWCYRVKLLPLKIIFGSDSCDTGCREHFNQKTWLELTLISDTWYDLPPATSVSFIGESIGKLWLKMRSCYLNVLYAPLCALRESLAKPCNIILLIQVSELSHSHSAFTNESSITRRSACDWLYFSQYQSIKMCPDQARCQSLGSAQDISALSRLCINLHSFAAFVLCILRN